MQKRFNRMHRNRMKRTKPTLDLKPVSNIMRRFNARKARMDRERKIEIVRMNKKLRKKIKAMTSVRASTQIAQNSCKFRSKLVVAERERVAKVNADNRALSARLKKIKDSSNSTHKSRRRMSGQPLTNSAIFAFRSALGRQLLTAVSHCPTKRLLRGLRRAETKGFALPRSPPRRSRPMTSSARMRRAENVLANIGSGTLYDSFVRKSHLPDRETISDDVLVGVVKRVNIPGREPLEPINADGHARTKTLWSVYVFDVAKRPGEETMNGAYSATRGLCVRAVTSVANGPERGGGVLSASSLRALSTFLRVHLVAEICSAQFPELQKALSSGESTIQRLHVALGSRAQELAEHLVERLRYHRGRLWIEGTEQWSRESAREDAAIARVVQDVRIYCQKREELRTARRLEAVRRDYDDQHGALRRPWTVSAASTVRVDGSSHRKLVSCMSDLESNVDIIQRCKTQIEQQQHHVVELAHHVLETSCALRRLTYEIEINDATIRATVSSARTNARCVHRDANDAANKINEMCQKSDEIFARHREEHGKLTKAFDENPRSCRARAFETTRNVCESEREYVEQMRQLSRELHDEVKRSIRKAIRRLDDATKAYRRYDVRCVAAVRIQAAHRGSLCRKHEVRRHEAAKLIQSASRGRRTRVTFRRRHVSAVKLQSVGRGHAERKKQRRRRRAATKIQSIQRGRRSRRRVTAASKVESSVCQGRSECVYRGAAKVGDTHYLLRIQSSSNMFTLVATDSETGNESSVSIGEPDVRAIVGSDSLRTTLEKLLLR